MRVNATNDATACQTDAAVHFDFAAIRFLSETFALGLRGDYYREARGDSGSDALADDFRPKSLGIGRRFVWTLAFAEGRLSILGGVMHDLRARDLFKSDCGAIGVARKV